MTIKTPDGKTLTIARKDILRINYSDDFKEQKYIYKTDGTELVGYIVRRDKDGYTYREKLTSPVEVYLKKNEIDSIQAKKREAVSRLPVPQGVSTTIAQYTDKIVVTWKKVPGIDQYNVYRSLKPDDAYQLIITTRNIRHEDKKVNESTVYYYKVQSTQEGLNSGFSAVATGMRAYSPVGYAFLNIYPGAGQIYYNNVGKGLLYLGIFTLLAGETAAMFIIGGTLYQTYLKLEQGTSLADFNAAHANAQTFYTIAFWSAIAAGAFYVWHWIDALFITKPQYAAAQPRKQAALEVFFQLNQTAVKLEYGSVDLQTVLSVGLRF